MPWNGDRTAFTGSFYYRDVLAKMCVGGFSPLNLKPITYSLITCSLKELESLPGYVTKVTNIWISTQSQGKEKQQGEKGKQHIPSSVELRVLLQAEWLSSHSNSCLLFLVWSPLVDHGRNERNLLQWLLENLRAQGKETSRIAINVSLLVWFRSTQSLLRMAAGQEQAAANPSQENSAFVLGDTFWYFCWWYLKNQMNRHLVHFTLFSKTMKLNAIFVD